MEHHIQQMSLLPSYYSNSCIHANPVNFIWSQRVGLPIKNVSVSLPRLPTWSYFVPEFWTPQRAEMSLLPSNNVVFV